MKPGNLLVILQVILVSVAFSQTYIPPGDVSGTLGFNGSPYYIQGDITIPNDSTLTIEPGVLVEFQGHYALNVQGQLLAIGTDTNIITFTVDDTAGFHNPETTLGGWNGIQFIDTPSENDTSKIIFCTLQYGKAVGSSTPDNAGGAIYVSNFNKVLIENCIITNNSAGGSDSPSGGGIDLAFANITLENNIISNNRAWDGGGIQIWESDVVFRNNIISYNKADEGGGGIWIGGQSTVVFNNDSIVGNGAANNGGGMVCWQTSDARLDSVILDNNVASFGGGIAVFECNLQLEYCNLSDNASSINGGGLNSESSTLVINNTDFNKDTASLSGGALAINNSELLLAGCNLIDNGAGIRGGGIFSNYSIIDIVNTTFERDTITVFGAAIQVNYSDLSLSNCNLVNNRAGILGGGIHSDSSNINVTNTIFERDMAGESGGGIVAVQSNLIINYCEFNSNTATSYSGGAIRSVSSPLTINNSNFTDNGAGILGGGIHSDFSNINITNTTFERDSTGESGGAIFTWQCDLLFDNCNFKNNTVAYHGGAICSDSSLIILDNSNFIQNSSIWGGGIKNQHGVLQMNNSSFIENSSEHGGAIYLEAGTTELTNISFVQNSSIWGGGISSTNCNLFVDSCLFSQNTATSEAGAIECLIDTAYFTEKLSVQIDNSRFLNNISENLFAGVKIRQDNSDTALCSVRMDNNLFKDNTAYSYSAIRFIGNIEDIIINNSIFDNNYNYSPIFHSIFSANGGAKVEVNNSVFANNYPRAASLNLNARIDFMNCTFTNNYGTNSAALSLRNNAEATITNSILWNNGNNPILLVNVGTSGSFLTVNYSDIQFGLDSIIAPDSLSVLNWGIGNLDSDPLFVDTLNNDFHLQDLSPCIGAGIDSIEIAGFWHYAPVTDIEGNPRPYPVGTMPDMGAYESQYPVKVEDNNLDLPTEFALYQNYPNPFNPSTIISWQLPVTSDVQLKVYDVIGNEVAKLVDGHKEAGHHNVEFDASALPSGVYFYTLTTGDFISTKKMILLK